MPVRIEIEGETVTCKHSGDVEFSATVDDFVTALAARAVIPPFPEAIPEGVRFIRRRGDAVVLAIEEKPTVRTVRWLADDSPVPYGRRARYKKARLAFPFVVLVVGFEDGGLTAQSQCFYRVSPLERPEDDLLLPNLFNVAKGYGQDCWLCLVNMQNGLSRLSWNDKVRAVSNHVFGASFNKSSEEHEGMSYWGLMRSLDPRISSVDAWEQESAKDPFFVLEVPWKPLGKSIDRVMGSMLGALSGKTVPMDASGLAHVLNTVTTRKR